MIIGDARRWSVVFPEDLVPRIIDLVRDTWKTFPKPAADDLEVPITRRFKHALKQAKDYRRLPVRIERELAEDDPLTGEELGRIDLKLSPADSALEEVYFAFECKRLNVIENGRRRTLAPQYVIEGMMRFVEGQYGGSMVQGGMVGYVLDGRCSHALRLVAKNIEARRQALKMKSDSTLAPSLLHSGIDEVRETMHILSTTRTFRLYHIFLEGATSSPAPVEGDSGNEP